MIAEICRALHTRTHAHTSGNMDKDHNNNNVRAKMDEQQKRKEEEEVRTLRLLSEVEAKLDEEEKKILEKVRKEEQVCAISFHIDFGWCRWGVMARC